MLQKIAEKENFLIDKSIKLEETVRKMSVETSIKNNGLDISKEDILHCKYE